MFFTLLEKERTRVDQCDATADGHPTRPEHGRLTNPQSSQSFIEQTASGCEALAQPVHLHAIKEMMQPGLNYRHTISLEPRGRPLAPAGGLQRVRPLARVFFLLDQDAPARGFRLR